MRRGLHTKQTASRVSPRLQATGTKRQHPKQPCHHSNTQRGRTRAGRDPKDTGPVAAAKVIDRRLRHRQLLQLRRCRMLPLLAVSGTVHVHVAATSRSAPAVRRPSLPALPLRARRIVHAAAEAAGLPAVLWAERLPLRHACGCMRGRAEGCAAACARARRAAAAAGLSFGRRQRAAGRPGKGRGQRLAREGGNHLCGGGLLVICQQLLPCRRRHSRLVRHSPCLLRRLRTRLGPLPAGHRRPGPLSRLDGRQGRRGRPPQSTAAPASQRRLARPLCRRRGVRCGCCLRLGPALRPPVLHLNLDFLCRRVLPLPQLH